MKKEREGIIIGAGFQKTGTSTLREALKILDYRVKDTSTELLIPILRKKYKRIIRALRNYDAVEDTPFFMIYKELDKLFPGSKFILTLRDEESWYKSVSRHIGNMRSPQHEWIYGRGKGLPKDDKENTIRVFLNHNREVKEYFKDRPDDLLILDFTSGDKWEKLCKFINKPVPDQKFPHYNKSSIDSDTNVIIIKKRIRLLRKRIKNYLKMNYITLMGYWE